MLTSTIKEKIIGYIVAAFGLVASLAWNEAIKSLINYFFPVVRQTLIAQFLYAACITLLAVIVSTYFVQFAHRDDEVHKV